MNDKEIQIEVLIDFGEYLKLAYINLFKKLWFFWIILFLVVGFTLFNAKNQNLNAILISLVPIFCIIIFLIASVYWSASRNMKNSPALSQKVRYKFSEFGVEVVGDSFESRMKWEMIIKAVEKANLILLYGTKQSAFMLPLRCFKNEQQIQAFKELISKNLGDRAYLKKSKSKLGLK